MPSAGTKGTAIVLDINKMGRGFYCKAGFGTICLDATIKATIKKGL